ncbi:MAG: 2'-5' RNA ligase family protein, partial [Proteobacteria bacterium]|nr:2'-5' RNA ligase family protein [Pseudomonadota bacterium]
VEPFELTLDHFGFFEKAKVFWVAPKTIPSALRKIHASLGDALTSCGYHGETRDYSPHVSLLRKAKSSPLDYPAFSINWKVKDFVLVESISTEGGVRYEVIARYPFNHSI